MNRITAGEWGQTILLEYVFLEIFTVLLLREDVTTAIEVGEALLQAREMSFVAGSEVFLEAWQVLKEQQRAKLSFADAAILAASGRADVQAIATFDRSLARASRKKIIP